MILRRLNPSDINQLKQIHGKFFAKEFDFQDLFGSSLSSLVITDDDDRIIVGGQVRAIAEATIVTNKDFIAADRRRALYQFLLHCRLTCASKGFDQLHAFVQDDKWLEHLKKVGFKETVGKSIVLNV